MNMTRFQGQVLLISTLVLSVVLLQIGLLGMIALISSSQSTSALENKRIAVASASACMESAMNRLARNGDYLGNETLMVASTTCAIRPIAGSSVPITIETRAQVGNQHARIRAMFSSRSPMAITSWVEVANF